MGKKKKSRRVSLGTLFMLALTALVLAGCVFLFSILVGDGLYEKTGALIRTLTAQGLFEETPEPQASDAPYAPAFLFAAEDTPAPSAVPVPTATPVPQASTIHIAAAGTIYAPKAVRESVLEGGRFDFGPVFEGLGDTLSSADLAIATLETTAAGKDKGFGNYNTAPEILDALRACGVDLLSLATERALDKGYDGLDLTISELTARGLAYAGVNPEGTGSRATMLRVDGVQVAVLAYTYGLSRDGEEKTHDDRLGVVSMIKTQRMAEDIRQARVDGANLVIVLPHWGTKNKLDVADHLRSTARTLAQAGADVIIGTHPNVAQETERMTVTRADGLEYDAVVCYSLGTLLTDARTQENTAGMIAHITVTHDPVTRHTTLGEMYCTPVYIARERVDDGAAYRVVDAESESALSLLSEAERERAREAVEVIRHITQTEGQEGQG